MAESIDSNIVVPFRCNRSIQYDISFIILYSLLNSNTEDREDGVFLDKRKTADAIASTVFLVEISGIEPLTS